MSNLATSFLQRQNIRRSRLPSTSTVSSNEAEENVRQHVAAQGNSPHEGHVQKTPISTPSSTSCAFFGKEISLSSCDRVLVGDQVTNVYHNIYAKVKCFLSTA
jgi:hypothetical protein